MEVVRIRLCLHTAATYPELELRQMVRQMGHPPEWGARWRAPDGTPTRVAPDGTHKSGCPICTNMIGYTQNGSLGFSDEFAGVPVDAAAGAGLVEMNR